MTAEGLVARANAALEHGELAAAIDLFHRSAEAHLAAGKMALASQGNRLAAVLSMTMGDARRAVALAERSLGQADGLRSRFEALTTLAEANRHRGNALAALAPLSEALALAADHGVAVATPVEHAALLRRRAGIRHAMGRDPDAVVDLRAASELLAGTGEAGQAAVTELELVGLLGASPAMRGALVAARRHANSTAATAGVLAQVDVVEASDALAADRVDRARELFRSARDGALEAVDPATYIAAVSGLAQADERAGDRVAAYGALASGWVTVADLLGRVVGVEAFRTQLEGARDRWGRAEFTRVKAAYERERRVARQSS